MRIPGIPYGPAPRTASRAAALVQPPKLVVVHCTANTASAEAEANYAATRTDDSSHWTSAHVYVDEGGPLGSLDLGLQAWAAYGWANAHGWHVELCGLVNAVPDAVQRIGAAIVRQLCLLGDIPMEHLDAGQVRALHDGTRTRGGVTGHLDITLAGFDGNDHNDPGDRFDWARFMAWVNGDDMDWSDTLTSTRGGKHPAGVWITGTNELVYYEVVPALRALAAKADAEAVRDAELRSLVQSSRAVIDALAAAVAAGGGSVETAALLARMDELAAETAAAESAAVTALRAEIAGLRAVLAQAAEAEAAELAGPGG